MIGFGRSCLTFVRTVAEPVFANAQRAGAHESTPFRVPQMDGYVQVRVNVALPDRTDPAKTAAFHVLISDDGSAWGRPYGVNGLTWQGNSKPVKRVGQWANGPAWKMNARKVSGKLLKVVAESASPLTFSAEVGTP